MLLLSKLKVILVSSAIERASQNSTYTNHYPRFQSIMHLMPGARREGNLYRYLTSWWLTKRIRSLNLQVIGRTPLPLDHHNSVINHFPMSMLVLT